MLPVRDGVLKTVKQTVNITVSVDTDCFVVGFSNIETKFWEKPPHVFQEWYRFLAIFFSLDYR